MRTKNYSITIISFMSESILCVTITSHIYVIVLYNDHTIARFPLSRFLVKNRHVCFELWDDYWWEIDTSAQDRNKISLKHARNFWQFLVFKKHQSWVWIVQSARIFISEHSDTYSHKIWNVIYRLVQIYKRIAKKFYPKLTIYLSTVFCRGH